MRALPFVGFCVLVGLLACDKKETEESDPPEKSAKTAASAPSTSPSGIAIPAGAQSPVPSLEEWNRVGEVTVKGSSALKCETKMVRDWFRVSCRGKNDTGGVPMTVSIVAGRVPGAYEYAVGGVTSLVTPFVAGTHTEAIFSWTDKSHRLVLD